QVKSLADSGVHYAAAALADKDTLAGTLSGNPFDNQGAFQGVIVQPNDLPYRQGRFSLVAPPDPDLSGLGSSSSFRYGGEDEGGKITLNPLLAVASSGQLALTLLMKLPNMTEECAEAILDWIVPDDEPRANGAENDYSSALSKPYRCKNGPLD